MTIAKTGNADDLELIFYMPDSWHFLDTGAYETFLMRCKDLALKPDHTAIHMDSDACWINDTALTDSPFHLLVNEIIRSGSSIEIEGLICFLHDSILPRPCLASPPEVAESFRKNPKRRGQSSAR